MWIENVQLLSVILQLMTPKFQFVHFQQLNETWVRCIIKMQWSFNEIITHEFQIEHEWIWCLQFRQVEINSMWIEIKFRWIMRLETQMFDCKMQRQTWLQCDVTPLQMRIGSCDMFQKQLLKRKFGHKKNDKNISTKQKLYIDWHKKKAPDQRCFFIM